MSTTKPIALDEINSTTQNSIFHQSLWENPIPEFWLVRAWRPLQIQLELTRPPVDFPIPDSPTYILYKHK